MSEQNPEQNEPQNSPEGDQAPPQVETIAPPETASDQPEVNPDTEAAVGKPDGNAVDASDDPNLGHAFEDQSHGVGVGPTQTSAEGEKSDGGDVAEHI